MEATGIETPKSSEDTNSPTSSEEIVYDKCYSANVFSDVAGSNFRKSDGIYVQQSGGGPEGGVVFSVNGNVYDVNREWHEPFTMKKIEGSPRFVVNSEDPDLMRQLKDGEEPTENEMEFECAEWHQDKWAQAKANYDEARLEEFWRNFMIHLLLILHQDQHLRRLNLLNLLNLLHRVSIFLE